MSTLTAPLTPDTNKLHRALIAGHQLRTGHPLVATLTSTDGEVWSITSTCCTR